MTVAFRTKTGKTVRFTPKKKSYYKGFSKKEFTQLAGQAGVTVVRRKRRLRRSISRPRKQRRVKALARRRRFGRRRSYGRRFARHFRGMGIPSIAGLGLTFYTLQKFGFFDAASQAIGGNLTGAAGTIASRASSINTYIGPVVGGLALKGVRSVAGPMVLGKVGKHSIRLW